MTAIEKSEWKCASWKKEKDFTEEVNLALNALTDKVYGRIEDIDRDTNPLFELEKMTRLNGDVENCKRVAVRIMTMYLQSNNLEQLLDIAQLLVHRRAQSALVQSAVIRELMNSLPSFSSTLDENVLIKCLVRIQDLTEGKIHVELEYGKVSVQLARLHEKMGSVAQAVHVLQHLQVESMTHMPKAEKLDVLVYHIALCIAIKDYTKAAIMSRKIGTKAIAAPEFRDLRVKYLELMSQYYAHFRNYYHLAICAWELYECTGRQPNSKHVQDAIIYFMACSPKSSEELIEEGECTAFSPLNVNGMDKATWLQKLAKLPEVKKFPVELSMIIIFTNVSWAPSVSISKHHKYLTDSGYEHVLKELDSRLIEHNIITLSKFYSQIYIHRLAEFVSATNTVVENTIMHLVTLNLTSAKINRVEGIVYFGKRVKFDDELEIWSQGISNVMSKINNTCHRIAKERMIHGH